MFDQVRHQDQPLAASRFIGVGLIAAVWFIASFASAQESPRKLLVGTELDFHPYAYVDDSGHPQGFSIDLIDAMAAEMGFEVGFKIGTWAEILQAIKDKEIDVVPLVKYTQERDLFLDFTVPHTIEYAVVVKRRDSPPIKSLPELSGKEVLVMEADATRLYLGEHAPEARQVTAPTVGKILQTLAGGAHEYAVVPQIVGQVKIRDMGLDGVLHPTGPRMAAYGAGFAFGVQDKDSETLTILNQGIERVKASGAYDRLYARWFSDVNSPNATWPWKSWLLWGVLALAVLLGAWYAKRKCGGRKQN